MRFTRVSAYWWLLGGGIALLAWLGVQQYRWIWRASEAERQERRQFLRNALGAIRGDVLERLRKPLSTLRPDQDLPSDSDFASLFKTRFDQWLQAGVDSTLLSELMVGWQDAQGKFKCVRIKSGAAAAEECEWPHSLSGYQVMVEREFPQPGRGPSFFPGGNTWAYRDSRLVLVVPIIEIPKVRFNSAKDDPDFRRDSRFSADSPMPAPRPAHHDLRGWIVLDYDPKGLKQLLHELVPRYFGEVGLSNYSISLISDKPFETLYRSDSAAQWTSADKADEEIPIFAPPRPDRNVRATGEGRFGRPEPPPADDGGPRPFDELPRWRLVARHKSGSLDAAVSRNRRQSLALSSGVLLLLLGSSVLLVLSTQRARHLAGRQIEFISGVSHELRTPLTVIQTTSYNLAQGKVTESRRVQQYGEAIQKEARRLTTQVEQVLSFAGIESGKKLYDLRPVDIADVIAHALAEFTPAFDAEGWKIERQIQAGLPQALTDPQVLEGALKNVIQNAQKYAASGRWLSVTAQSAAQRSRLEIQITIADHGPGIQPSDLPHIFEPFYRGHSQTAGPAAPGVGLGLCLVQRHLRAMSGRISVKTDSREGTAFTFHIPSVNPLKAI